MRYRNLYAMAGICLGLGAPLGSIVVQGLWQNHHWWSQWVMMEWHLHAFFYSYMAVGCLAVFTSFGYVLGCRADRLRQESEDLSDTFQTLNLLAIKDGLTGLYNHRYLQERLSLEMEVADRRNSSLACLMIDLDDFKAVNDQCGHPFGDTVLSNIARMIRENIRHIDTAGRYGGEEFLVIMPQSSLEVAQTVAERIRKSVEDHVFKTRLSRIKVTLSVGVAAYPMAGLKAEDKSAFLKVVDDALYRAKNSGKNRVFCQTVNNHGRRLQEEAR